MPRPKTLDLLSQLSRLEDTINTFSFDALPIDEAKELKETFLSFKMNLEAKLWGQKYTTQKEIKKSLSKEIFNIDSSINTQNSAPQIDLQPILAECMGELDLLEELVKLYKQNALEFIGIAKVSIENKDFETLTFAAHKIKCGLKMIEVPKLFELVKSIHTVSGTTQDHAYLKFLYDCFLEEYPRVEVAIDNQLELLLLKRKIT